MTEELEVLWGLKELDERRSALNSGLARYPAQRAELEKRVASERARLEALKARVGDLQKRRREREREIEAATVEERRFQSQLPAIKKNDEYTALLHEIAAAKAKRSEIETEVLLMFEEEEKVQGERPAIEQALEAAVREAAERHALLEAEEKQDRERLERVESERGAHLARLVPAIRLRYERIHGSRDGRAVVAIVKGACGGCFRAQPPQTLSEAKRGDRLLACDGCGRLMVWPPGGG
jgi:hypothetical protein